MKKRPVGEYFLFAEAWLLLVLARVILLFFPFRKIAGLLGKAMYEAPSNESFSNSEVLAKVQLSVARATGYTPLRAKCFEQAVAAKIMLKRRHICSTVFFGVLKNEVNEIRAHAWLKSNAVIVTGGPDITMFTIISWFGS